jgi:endoglucanase
MKFFDILLGLTGATVASAAVVDHPTPTIKRASKFQFVGVNQAGAEFGNKDLPGTLGKHYTWPVHSTIDVSARIPFPYIKTR